MTQGATLQYRPRELLWNHYSCIEMTTLQLQVHAPIVVAVRSLVRGPDTHELSARSPSFGPFIDSRLISVTAFYVQ